MRHSAHGVLYFCVQEQGVGEEYLSPYKAAVRRLEREIKACPRD